MIIKRVLVSSVILWLVICPTVQSANTVRSTVETKTGVSFHGENPNKTGHNTENNNNSGGSCNQSAHLDDLPQTGEVKPSSGFKIIGSYIFVSALVGYFLNKIKNKGVS